jgi:plastocyanin domain-containing protein
MQKNTIIVIAVGAIIIASLIYLFTGKTAGKDIQEKNQSAQIQNVEVRDGVQYVTIDARGGYFPKESSIRPNMPTKLIIRTNNTYDCSASLVIRSANFQKMLKPTGEEIIDLGTLKSGQEIDGTCGMGMYGFKIVAG